MKTKVAVLFLFFALTGSVLIHIPFVKAAATYEYDGWGVYITGATANFAGWYAADQAGGWGTIGRTSTNDYYLDGNYVTYIYIGNSTHSCTFYDWSKQVDFDYVSWVIANGSTLTLGRIHPLTGQPRDTVQIIDNVEIKGDAGSTLNFYATDLSGGLVISESENPTKMYQCHFYSVSIAAKNMDMDKCVLSLSWFRGLDYEIGGNVSDIYVETSTLVGVTSNYNVSINNATCINTFIVSTWPGLTWTGTCNLTDVTSNSWNIGWVGAYDTGVVWRKNSYSLTATFQNGTAINGSMMGARAIIQHYGQGGGVDYNATLSENGTITPQTLTVGFYNATGDDDIYDFNPYSLTIYNATGFQTVSFNFTLGEKIDLTIPLSPNNSPISRFTFFPSNPEPNELIFFNASDSTDPDGSISSYSWDFGDETTVSTETVNKLYTNAGTYLVNLTVTDDGGISGWFAQNVTVAVDPLLGVQESVETLQLNLTLTKPPVVVNEHITEFLAGYPVKAEFTIQNKINNTLNGSIYAFLTTSNNHVIDVMRQNATIVPGSTPYRVLLNFRVPVKPEKYTLQIRVYYYYADKLWSTADVRGVLSVNVVFVVVELVIIICLIVGVLGLVFGKKREQV